MPKFHQAPSWKDQEQLGGEDEEQAAREHLNKVSRHREDVSSLFFFLGGDTYSDDSG